MPKSAASGKHRQPHGEAANTFTSILRAKSCVLNFNKIVGTPCFGGNLEIAGANVYVRTSHQIPDTAAISMSSGTLFISDKSDGAFTTEKISNLSSSVDAYVRAYPSNTLVLGGNISCTDSTTARLGLRADSGAPITIGGASRTFSTPNSSSRITILGSVTDGGASAGLIKTGPGSLQLTDSNSLSGAFSIQGGILSTFNSGALGTTLASTTISAGATLSLETAMTLPAGETLNLSGILDVQSSSTIPGPIALAGSPTLSAAYSAALTGVLSGSANPVTIGHLYGTGASGAKVNLGDATLTLNGTTDGQFGTSLNGGRAIFFGSALSKLRKLGRNTWTIHTFDAPGGSTTFPTLSVEAGSVVMYDQWSGPISGMGDSDCLCDFKSTGPSGSTTILADIEGATPGKDFDRMVVNGPVNLSGSTLQTSINFLTMKGGSFTIIENKGANPVSGTFLELPEGAELLIGGQPFKITYQGGILRKDVVLRFQGTGTPGQEITAITRQPDGKIKIDVRWALGAKVSLLHNLDGLTGAWARLTSLTMNASGNATFLQSFPKTKEFYRLAAF